MYPCHINDPEFADALVDTFLEISMNNPMDSTHSSPPQIAICEHSKDHDISSMNLSSYGTIYHSPNNYPDARPGYIQNASLF